ncbi:MAG: hypothetical protein Q8N53_23465, partial [Longimicrobiales bacterium]|nr:hypothetical protein [Longimicrobiales bacterium]
MKKLMTCLALGAFATLLAAAPTSSALAHSQPEEATFVVTEPLDVGTVTLQPATYHIKVVKIDSNKDMLRVMDAEQTKIFTTVLTRPYPITMGEVIPESRYVVWSTPAGQPQVLRTWFAADRSIGHEVVYSQKRAMELAAIARERVIAVPDEVTEDTYSTAPLLIVTPERQVKPYEPRLAEREPAPLQVAETRELPETASRVPLFAALGLLSLAGAHV